MDMYVQTTHVHTYVHYIGTVVYSIGNLKAIKDADIANSSKEISWVCRLTLSGIMKVKVDKIPGQEIIKCIHTVSMLMRMFTDWSNYCTCRYVKEPLLDLECFGLLQVSNKVYCFSSNWITRLLSELWCPVNGDPWQSLRLNHVPSIKHSDINCHVIWTNLHNRATILNSIYTLKRHTKLVLCP